MAERFHRGRATSPGLAIGPLVRVERKGAAERPAGSPAEESRRLREALARAREELVALAAATPAIGGDVLEFQVALLEDASLAESAFAALQAGGGAVRAWRLCLDAQIGEYEAAEDDYFRARASDLRDLQERVLTALHGGGPAAELPVGAILLDRDLTPSRFLSLDWSVLGGAALEAGSPSSHVAMLARARGVPLVTNLDGSPAPAAEAVLDAEEGLLVVAPEAATRIRYRARIGVRAAEASLAAVARSAPAVTASGERVEVTLNVDHPDAVSDETLAAADGVGLLRTEFLFIGRDRLPDEAEQLAVYLGLLDRLDGKPCVVRTLDVGGDKPLPGVSLPEESNPFLGLRGLRLCLERPELFRPQVRALLRAAPGRPLKVMLPMVATAGELAEARAFFAACLDELAAEGVPAAMPPLGIMVETPAAAVAVDLLAADFWSIGSNDLTQYVMAASRDAGGRVAALLDPLHPAVLRLIERVVRHGADTGTPVSLCGDMASTPAGVEALLRLGLRRLSVAPAALGQFKLAVAGFGATRG
jgi:phosphotransferase system enzyme I (PtsI)